MRDLKLKGFRERHGLALTRNTSLKSGYLHEKWPVFNDALIEFWSFFPKNYQKLKCQCYDQNQGYPNVYFHDFTMKFCLFLRFFDQNQAIFTRNSQKLAEKVGQSFEKMTQFFAQNSQKWYIFDKNLKKLVRPYEILDRFLKSILQ